MITMSGSTLGTRHRAGVGVTETTDAVSVVVSEETGEISVALAGRLTPVADATRLSTVLHWLLNPVQQRQSIAVARSPS
jgi:diadenylate cyclase